MPYINCTECGDKVWGSEDSLPEVGYCRGCKPVKTNIIDTKLELVIELLSELKHEQSLIRNQIYNLENTVINELYKMKTSLCQNEISRDISESNGDGEYIEYGKADAAAEAADEETMTEQQEAEYNDKEREAEQSGEDYKSYDN
jgi:hypothetical protein